jgi:hypothetical protein
LPFARKELAQADPESAIAENVESIVPINDVVYGSDEHRLV